jgi:hypothetical protein
MTYCEVTAKCWWDVWSYGLSSYDQLVRKVSRMTWSISNTGMRPLYCYATQGSWSSLRNSLFYSEAKSRDTNDCLWVNRTWSVLCGMSRSLHLFINLNLWWKSHIVSEIWPCNSFEREGPIVFNENMKIRCRHNANSSLEIELLSQSSFLLLLNVKCYHSVHRRPLLTEFWASWIHSTGLRRL